MEKGKKEIWLLKGTYTDVAVKELLIKIRDLKQNVDIIFLG